MTDTPTWIIGLSGSRYTAAVNLHTTARPPVDARALATATADAHIVGLERDTIATIVRDARPRVTKIELDALTRYRRHLPRVPSFYLGDTITEHKDDGPGWWGPYTELCAELHRRVTTGELDLHEAIDWAAAIAGDQDPELACLIACAELSGWDHELDHDPVTPGDRFTVCTRIWWEMAA